MVSFFLIIGKMPYSGLGGIEIIDYLNAGKKLKQPDGCSDEMWVPIIMIIKYNNDDDNHKFQYSTSNIWLYSLFVWCHLLILGRRSKFIPHRGTTGGVDGTLPRSFWYVAVFWKDFTFSRKPLIFLTRWGIFYGWWRCWRPVTSPTMVAILAAILEFTKN